GGNDLVDISSSDYDVTNNFGGSLTLDGQSNLASGPLDRLEVNDQNTAFDADWTVTESTIDKTNAFPTEPLVTYAGFEFTTLSGGGGATLYNVDVASGSTAITVNTGDGQDAVFVGSSTTTPITIHGQGGFDTVDVNLDDSGLCIVRFANTQRLK